MDIERALVSKIIFTGQLDKVLSRNVVIEQFADEECRQIYRYIVNFFRQYASPPSLELAKHDNQDFEWYQVQETIDVLIDRFADIVLRRQAAEAVIELSEALDDPERSKKIDVEFLEVARRLVTSVPGTHNDSFREAHRRIETYEEDKVKGKTPGVPYGFPTLDRLTGGIQSHELVTVLGFTNVGKSTLLRVLCYNFWLKGYTPLYISLEMEAKILLRIFDSMATGLDYTRMKHLRLTDAEMTSWREQAAKIAKHKADIQVVDSIHRMTPDQLYALALRHRPGVIVLDYVGLMRSSDTARGVKRYQQISEITQDLKHYARSMKIPIVMAAQTNRAGAKDGAELDNVGDGISITQDSDTVLGLFQDSDMERANEMEIRLNKNRDGPRGKFRAKWDFDTMEFREKALQDFKRE